MERYLENSIARDLLRLALQIAPGVSHDDIKANLSGIVRPKDDPIGHYRQRLLLLDRGLTAREIDVCARSLLGMTAEGIGLELGIKMSSVATYRKRAYDRLDISSRHELFRLIA